jgi:hypothetical protein
LELPLADGQAQNAASILACQKACCPAMPASHVRDVHSRFDSGEMGAIAQQHFLRFSGRLFSCGK